MDIDIFDINVDDNRILEMANKDLDIGLKTIQLATILAQDIILKLKDTQSFVTLT